MPSVHPRGFFTIVKFRFHKTALVLNGNVMNYAICTYRIKKKKINLVLLLTIAEIPVTMRMK